MKKKHMLIVIVAIILVIFAIFTISLLGEIVPTDSSVGPAPNSGDGISDGSGLEQPNYQNELRPEMSQSIISCIVTQKHPNF
jgi:hypothetical protein